MFNINEFLGTSEIQEEKMPKINFLSLKYYGIYKVRFIEKFSIINTHYFTGGKFSALCLGDNHCPVCENNYRIISAYPNDFRDQQGFFNRSTRYVANVYDLTLSKVCSSCGYDIPVFAPITSCPRCGETLSDKDIVPSKKVKLASFSQTFISVLREIASSIVDENNNVIPITNYNCQIVVAKAGEKKTTMPSPDLKSINEPIEVNEPLYDHSKIAISLSSDELMMAMQGTPLRDILKSRNKTTEIVGSQVSSPSQDEVEKIIKELYG